MTTYIMIAAATIVLIYLFDKVRKNRRDDIELAATHLTEIDFAFERMTKELEELKVRLEQVERSKGGGGSNAGADANEKPGDAVGYINWPGDCVLKNKSVELFFGKVDK